jgi:hypothetical protein
MTPNQPSDPDLSGEDRDTMVAPPPPEAKPQADDRETMVAPPPEAMLRQAAAADSRPRPRVDSDATSLYAGPLPPAPPLPPAQPIPEPPPMPPRPAEDATELYSGPLPAPPPEPGPPAIIAPIAPPKPGEVRTAQGTIRMDVDANRAGMAAYLAAHPEMFGPRPPPPPPPPLKATQALPTLGPIQEPPGTPSSAPIPPAAPMTRPDAFAPAVRNPAAHSFPAGLSTGALVAIVLISAGLAGALLTVLLRWLL